MGSKAFLFVIGSQTLSLSSDLKYKHVMIVIYNRNHCGLYQPVTIVDLVLDSSMNYNRRGMIKGILQYAADL